MLIGTSGAQSRLILSIGIVEVMGVHQNPGPRERLCLPLSTHVNLMNPPEMPCRFGIIA